jgi:hypothetical protein
MVLNPSKHTNTTHPSAHQTAVRFDLQGQERTRIALRLTRRSLAAIDGRLKLRVACVVPLYNHALFCLMVDAT